MLKCFDLNINLNMNNNLMECWNAGGKLERRLSEARRMKIDGLSTEDTSTLAEVENNAIKKFHKIIFKDKNFQFHEFFISTQPLGFTFL